jgi:hypothetical protein
MLKELAMLEEGQSAILRQMAVMCAVLQCVRDGQSIPLARG